MTETIAHSDGDAPPPIPGRNAHTDHAAVRPNCEAQPGRTAL